MTSAAERSQKSNSEPESRREAVIVNRTGLTILYEPDETIPTVDLVFIHGLQGHPLDTWTAQCLIKVEEPKRKVVQRFLSKQLHKTYSHSANAASEPHNKLATYWPGDLLPDECPNARIMTFGYDSDVSKFFGGCANQNTFYQHAKALLYALDRLRRKDRTRPLLFVAHSMGGIILKQMLLDSSLSEGNVELQHIANSTTALVFLGTPHRGSNWTGWGKIAATVAAAALFDVQKDNIEILDANGECLSQLEQNFGRLIHRRTFKIHSFQESKGMAGVRGLTTKIVEDWSSKLGDPGRERLEPINANHMDMCRFYGRSDPGYQQVGGQIQGLVEEAEANRSKEGIMASLCLPGILGAHVSEAYDQTCGWIAKHDGYQKWLEQRKGFFWIKGKPGCGKSTLVKYLWQLHAKPEASVPSVNRSKRDTRNKNRISAAFFFNGRGTILEQTPVGLYRSLLYQILDQSSTLYCRFSKVLKEKYAELVKDADEPARDCEPWGLQELEGIFTSIFKSKDIKLSITLFLDALDECQENEWDNVLTLLRKCIEYSESTDIEFSICFSSRHNPEIEVGECQSLILQDENHGDIAEFVQAQLTSKAISGRKTKYFKSFADQVINKADGVFLWVSLVVPKLRKAINRGDTLARLQDMLDDIPIPLEELFEHILQKLDNDTLPDTVHILRWALFSDTYLSLDQFRHTFVSQPNCPCATVTEWENSGEYIEDNEQMEQQIESRCGGLVEVLDYDPDDQQTLLAKRFQVLRDVQPIPSNIKSSMFTRKPYLKGWDQTKMPDYPDTDNLDTLRSFSEAHQADNKIPHKASTASDFSPYRGEEKASPRLQRRVQMIHQTAKQYFIRGDGFGRLAAMIKKSQGNKMQNAFVSSLSKYHISSGHDYLARSCAHYLMLPEMAPGDSNRWLGNLEVSSPFGRFPLEEYATRSCFKHAGKADSHGMSQDHLYWASKYLSRGALEILLTIAAENNILSWIGLLQEDKVDFNTHKIGYGKPIKAAVKHGHLKMVSVLVDCGSDVDGTEVNDQSALSIAYSKGDQAMVELLTQKGAKVDLKHRIQSTDPDQDNLESRVSVMELLKYGNLRNPYRSRVQEED